MKCPHCARHNAEQRRFCGACGVSLAIACPSCQFVNDVTDRFCGGCGITIQAPTAQMQAPEANATGVVMLSMAELHSLLAEIPTTGAATATLPQGPIGQSDLDRLFGGVE